MNELQTQTVQLPDTIEDLTQFVLVSKAKLQAYMLKLQTVNKLSVAQEIRDQTLKEAQEVSTALIAAEQRIGELLLAIPKASGGVNQYNKEEKSTRVEKSKSETISEMGYTKDEASDYQQMAKNPEIVQKVLDDALADGTVVTKSQVMKEIRDANRKATEENERLKRIISEREAENIRLKNQKPEVREIIKEVVPKDYEKTKTDFESYKKDYQRMVNERQTAVNEAIEAKRKLREMEKGMADSKSQLKLEEDSEFFAIRVYDFIKQNGGYVWIFNKINELPESKRQNFVKAIFALDAYTKQMVENIGGYGIE